MWAKAALMFLLFVGPYILMISFHFEFYQLLLLSVIAGVGMAGIGFNIAHDACHNAFSKNPAVNRILGLGFNLIGMSDYIWKITHNVFHHTYTNVYEKDEALKESNAFRFSPDAPHRPILRFQHLYALPSYSLYTLTWLFLYDFEKLLKYNGYGSADPADKHPLSEILILISSKLIYLFVALIIPIFFTGLNVWTVIICFLVMHLVAGTLTTTFAQPAHIVESTVHITPDDDGNIEHNWMVHEMMTTTNYGTKNKFITWFTGGLNFQIEHHLFPKVCSVHYESIAPIVKGAALKYGIPYNEIGSHRVAVLEHLKMLKELGRGGKF